MTALDELPRPMEKTTSSATVEFTNWDWSSKEF